MSRPRVVYALITATVALALGLGYVLGLARVPFVEACVIAFAFGMGWNATLPATIRAIGRVIG